MAVSADRVLQEHPQIRIKSVCGLIPANVSSIMIVDALFKPARWSSQVIQT